VADFHSYNGFRLGKGGRLPAVPGSDRDAEQERKVYLEQWGCTLYASRKTANRVQRFTVLLQSAIRARNVFDYARRMVERTEGIRLWFSVKAFAPRSRWTARRRSF
jgi:hypothetical protein